MARNSTTTTDTTSTSTGTKKRKFGASTANIPSQAPTILPKIYIGTLKNIKVEAPDKMNAYSQGNEDLQLFDIVQGVTWTKEKNEQGKSTPIHDGIYTIQGGFTFGAELANIPEVQELPIDTMTIFGGRVNIYFDRDEDGNWNLSNRSTDYGVVNKTWKAFQTAIGLEDSTIDEVLDAVPFDEDMEVEVPERLAHVEGIEDMIKAVEFYKTLFTLLLSEYANGKEVKVDVIQRNRFNSEDELENLINVGFSKGQANYSRCGILANKEA